MRFSAKPLLVLLWGAAIRTLNQIELSDFLRHEDRQTVYQTPKRRPCRTGGWPAVAVQKPLLGPKTSLDSAEILKYFNLVDFLYFYFGLSLIFETFRLRKVLRFFAKPLLVLLWGAAIRKLNQIELSGFLRHEDRQTVYQTPKGRPRQTSGWPAVAVQKLLLGPKTSLDSAEILKYLNLVDFLYFYFGLSLIFETFRLRKVLRFFAKPLLVLLWGAAIRKLNQIELSGFLRHEDRQTVYQTPKGRPRQTSGWPAVAVQKPLLGPKTSLDSGEILKYLNLVDFLYFYFGLSLIFETFRLRKVLRFFAKPRLVLVWGAAIWKLHQVELSGFLCREDLRTVYQTPKGRPRQTSGWPAVEVQKPLLGPKTRLDSAEILKYLNLVDFLYFYFGLSLIFETFRLRKVLRFFAKPLLVLLWGAAIRKLNQIELSGFLRHEDRQTVYQTPKGWPRQTSGWPAVAVQKLLLGPKTSLDSAEILKYLNLVDFLYFYFGLSLIFETFRLRKVLRFFAKPLLVLLWGAAIRKLNQIELSGFLRHEDRQTVYQTPKGRPRQTSGWPAVVVQKLLLGPKTSLDSAEILKYLNLVDFLYFYFGLSLIKLSDLKKFCDFQQNRFWSYFEGLPFEH